MLNTKTQKFTLKTKFKIIVMRLLLRRYKQTQCFQQFIYNHHWYLPTYKYKKLSVNRKVEIYQDINLVYSILNYYLSAVLYVDKSILNNSDENYYIKPDIAWLDMRSCLKRIHNNCETWEIMKPLGIVILNMVTRTRLEW